MRNPTKDWSKLWPVIQAEYQKGQSVFNLSLTYSVPRQSIQRRAREFKWLKVAPQSSISKLHRKVAPPKLHPKTELLNRVAVRTVKEALAGATQAGRQIAHSAGAFVQRTLDEVTEWLDLIADLRRRLPPEASLQFMPQWRTAIEKGREAYRLDDVDPVQPLVRIDTISQALDLYEAAPGQWEQQVGASVVSPPDVAPVLHDPTNPT